MTDPAKPPVALAIDDLSITLPNGRRLLDKAQLAVRRGDLVLLIGPSGSGKSTLLRHIAGLNGRDESGLHIEGQVRVEGTATTAEQVRTDTSVAHPRSAVGLVFQDHALFDELSALENVQFAADHRQRSEPGVGTSPAELLHQLNVAPHAKPATLSGGERQRVAVARTLAYDPPILLFDEPTTGLDPGRSRAVVDLIAETHGASEQSNAAANKTVIVVTHDYTPFLPLHPRLVWLDPESGKLLDVDESALHARFDTYDPDHSTLYASRQTGEPTSPDTPVRPPPQSPSRWFALLEAPGEIVFMLLAVFAAIPTGWNQPTWKLRYLWYYTRLVAVGSTAIYVAAGGAMLGFVSVSFSFAQLPYNEVTVPLLTEEFLAATGYSTFRVIVPLLVAVLVAGKCGASIAADVGTRRYAHQLDAMRLCGGDPQSYLYGNIAIALIVGVPLLTVVAFVANAYASLLAFLMASDEATIALFWRNYFATLWPADLLLPKGLWWMLIKMSTSGMLIGAISYTIGTRPKSSPVDVSRDVGATIFWASLAVLMLHSVFSHVEF